MRNPSKKTMKHMLIIMVDALEKYASECEKRMKDADMDMEREYYNHRADIDYFIDLVRNYPSPDYTLPAFFKEDSK